MTARDKKRKLTAIIAMADAEEHGKLRQLLTDHRPLTYGELRRNSAISPIFLETQIDRYPEIFEAGVELASGKPTIRLKDGQLPSREDVLMRRLVVKKIREAGVTGIRLLRLYSATRIASKKVQQLLEGVDNITTTVKGREILYRWTGGQENLGLPEKSRIQESQPPANPLPEPIGEPNAQLEDTRNKLVYWCKGSPGRHLSWLSIFLDETLVRQVLVESPDKFDSEIVNLGGPSDLIIRLKASADAMPAPPAVADNSSSVPQVSEGPPQPLEEIYADDPSQLAELKFKPPCRGMGSRRNGRIVTKDHRQRDRYPLIQI
jgi:hypothetical protein